MPTLAAEPPVVVAEAPAPLRINLLELAPRCSAGSGDEIVVCANNDAPYRLKPLDPRFERRPLAAEVSLGGGVRGAIVGETATLGGGNVSQRVMVTIKTRF